MATAAAAAVAAARRRIIEHFMAAGAIDAKTAVAYQPLSLAQRRIFDSYVTSHVLLAAGEDSYYIDLPAYVRDRKARKLRAAKITVLVVAIGAAVAAIGVMH